MQTSRNKEAGFVSLFTVIFFILFITVITVGFLRIMSLEQQQALNNDLTASAIASAESGIEDGKRAILAYNTTTDPALKAALTTAFASTACNSLTNSAVIRNSLKLDAGGNVIGNAALNQYYTCLTVNLKSPNYISYRSAQSSDYIPLVAVGGRFEQIKVSWHLITQAVGGEGGGDGIPSGYAPSTLLPPLVNVNGNPGNSWTTPGGAAAPYPAYLRVQLYGYPTNPPNFTRADIDARTHSLLLVPTSLPSAGGPIDFAANDPRGFDQNKISLQPVECVSSPSSNIGAYACSATLDLPGGAALDSTRNNYFLRVTPVYGQSHFQVSLLHSGAPVDFDGVQPIIDATGRANDVFRRLQARVRLDPVGALPEYVVQSANTICKNMVVSDGSFYQPNNCP